MSISVPLQAAFVDASLKSNTLFPSVSNYSDGRILILLLTAILCALLSIIVLAGWLPSSFTRFDAFTSKLEPSDADAGRLTYSRSRFGAWMTMLAGLVATGLLGDVLIQFSDDFWYENSINVPYLDSSPLQATNGRVELYITSTRAPGSSSPCIVTQLTVNGYIPGSFQLTRAQLVSGTATDPNAAQCLFTLVHASFQLAPPVYPAAPLASQPTLAVTLGPNLQVTSWSMRVFDAKSGAYTNAAPPDTSALAFNASAGRAHTITTLCTTSKYTDRTYFSAPGGAVSTAYRAAFMTYSLAPNSNTQLQDTMVFTFQLNTFILATDRSPRLSILQLLGILFGLALGILALTKLLHDAGDILFDATTISARDARACRCCRRGNNGGSKMVLSAVTPARARSERFVDALGRPLSSKLIPYAAPAAMRVASEVAARPMSASLRNFDSLMSGAGTGMSPQRSALARMQSRMDATTDTGEPLRRVQSSWVGNPITSSIPTTSNANDQLLDASHAAAEPPTAADSSFGATRTGFTASIPPAQSAPRPKPHGPGRKPLSSSAGTSVASPAPSPGANASSTSVFAGRNPLKPASALPPPETNWSPSVGLSATAVAGGSNAGVAAAIQTLRAQFEH